MNGKSTEIFKTNKKADTRIGFIITVSVFAAIIVVMIVLYLGYKVGSRTGTSLVAHQLSNEINYACDRKEGNYKESVFVKIPADSYLVCDIKSNDYEGCDVFEGGKCTDKCICAAHETKDGLSCFSCYKLDCRVKFEIPEDFKKYVQNCGGAAGDYYLKSCSSHPLSLRMDIFPEKEDEEIKIVKVKIIHEPKE